MRAVKSKDTKPEMIVRKYLFALGFRYRIHDKRLPGIPDIYLPKYNVVIFVNGCFWHGHKNCFKSHIPKSNVDFWKNKLESNILRDNKIYKEIRKLGYKIIVVWECQVSQSNSLNNLKRIVKKVKNVKN